MNSFDNKELEITGYYNMPGCFGKPPVPVPRHNYPITPKENLLRVFRGEKPMWIPNTDLDVNYIQPYIMPDSYAQAFGGTDWFGIEWVYEPVARGAMVKPGTRVLSDITNWREEVRFPDLSAIDWNADYEALYKGHIAEDRLSVFCIVNGLFERTADMMGFEETVDALLTKPEELTAFYDRLVEWHIELLHIAREVYHADMILFHDDMGTQISTFFSPDIYKKLFVPQYQKITKAAHDMGMLMSLHSCGCISMIIPLIIEAGFDGWEGQDSANDKKTLMDAYGDQLVQYSLFYIPQSFADKEAVEYLQKQCREIGGKGRYTCRIIDPAAASRSVNLSDELYRYSRMMYAGMENGLPLSRTD